MLYSEAVGRRCWNLQKFVQVSSANAAKLFGLWPRKASLQPGADADLVIFDPSRQVRLTGELMQSRSDYDAHEGYECTGWPVTVISRGDVVYADGAIRSQPGRGQLIRRARTAP
jgi:dihydropyrimidinase